MSQRRLSTRGITEGAILAALVAIFALVTRFIPIVGVFTAFLVPLPLTVLVIRQGLTPAVVAAGLAGVLGTMIAGPLVGGAILLTFAPIGIAIGWGAQRGKKASTIVLLASGAVVVSFVFQMAAVLAVSGVDSVSVLNDAMRAGAKQQEAAMDLYRRLGVSQAELDRLGEQTRLALALAPKILPALGVAFALMIGWLNFQVGRLILGRLGYLMPALPPGSTWRLPPSVIWLYLLAFLLIVIGMRPTRGPFIPGPEEGFPGTPPAALGLNLMVVLQLLFAFQGVLVIWVLLTRYDVPMAFRVLVLAFLIPNPIFGPVAILLGLADHVVLLRERIRSQPVAAGGEA